MKTIIKTDFSRAFLNPRFPAAIFITYLVWELNSRRFGTPEDVLYLFIHVWGRSITYLLAIVSSAMVYTTSYCEDVEHDFLRYSILRTGVSRYVGSKILICFCSAFCAFLLGTVSFLFIQSLSLPFTAPNSISIENFQTVGCFGGLLATHTEAYVILQTVLYGLSCGGMSVLALAFSTFIRNSYGVYAIPFLLHYCFFYLFGKLTGRYPFLAIERIFDCLTPYTDSPGFFLLYGAFVILVFILTAYIIMFKKIKGVFQ